MQDNDDDLRIKEEILKMKNFITSYTRADLLELPL